MLSSPNAKADNTDGVISDGSASSTTNIADNDDHTALHLACIHGHLEVVKYLCKHDAYLEAWYICMNSILNYVSTTSHVYVCMCVHVHMYANSHICITFSGGEDGTPLACAANKGHVNILNYLILEQKVDVNGKSKVSIQLP